MMTANSKSLKWRLVMRIAASQGAIFFAIVLGMMATIGTLWMRGSIDSGNFQMSTIRALTEAMARSDDGRLIVRKTPEITRLRAEIDNFWFLVRDDNGYEVAEGNVPVELRSLARSQNRVQSARILSGTEMNGPPLAVLQRVSTSVGELEMVTNGQGSVRFVQLLESFGPALGLTSGIVGLMTLATFLVTPFSIRRALSSVQQVADEAREIDINRSGVRLTLDDVPTEIAPLVTAINDALSRIDVGYESHKRFLADAAHELRTPVAILTTRISDLNPGPERTRLLEDTMRLTVLTGQLLDLQRLDQKRTRFVPVDLVMIAERVVLDIAPLAFAAGYEVAFDSEAPHVVVVGDEMSLERVFTNLIQNAIDHGGRRGTIMVRVATAGWLEVCDEGDGIPPDRRKQIFEPFHRLRHGGPGTGLGLDLVRRIMRMHGGRAEVISGPSDGACFRLVFPTTGSDLHERRGTVSG